MKYSKRIAALLLALTLCCCAACSKTVGSYRVVKTLSTEQFRIGFRDGDQAAVYVNAALKVLAADGTIHSLALKWFGTDNTTFDSDAGALDALGDIPQRTFIMGLNEERFPMSYADGDGYSGFDVELAQAVCARLGWTLQYQSIANRNAYVELSSEEKLMKNLGAAQRVTGGSKACFEALAAGSCAAIVADSAALAYYTH